MNSSSPLPDSKRRRRCTASREITKGSGCAFNAHAALPHSSAKTFVKNWVKCRRAASFAPRTGARNDHSRCYVIADVRAMKCYAAVAQLVPHIVTLLADAKSANAKGRVAR